MFGPRKSVLSVDLEEPLVNQADVCCILQRSPVGSFSPSHDAWLL